MLLSYITGLSEGCENYMMINSVIIIIIMI